MAVVRAGRYGPRWWLRRVASALRCECAGRMGLAPLARRRVSTVRRADHETRTFLSAVVDWPIGSSSIDEEA